MIKVKLNPNKMNITYRHLHKPAESVRDFYARYYRHDRLEGRYTPEEVEQYLKNREDEFAADGYVFVSRHDNTSGHAIAFYGQEGDK